MKYWNGRIEGYKYLYEYNDCDCEKIIKPIKWEYDDYEVFDEYDPCHRSGTGVLVIDQYERNIELLLGSGVRPYFNSILNLIISDKHVRRMIREYQETKRVHKFQINSTKGMSGREDYYINFYNKYGVQTWGKKLLHISCEGKINQGVPCIYIGDFVELISYISKNEPWNILPRKKARRLSNCRYIKEFYYSNDADTKVSKII